MVHHISKQKSLTVLVLLMTSVIVLAALIFHLDTHAAPAQTQQHFVPDGTQGGWATYLYSNRHTGNNPNETIISASNVSSLKLKWAFPMQDRMPAEPIVVNGIVYEGNWDGYMYAIHANTGTLKWKTYLGVFTSPTCTRYLRGISGTATVLNGVVYAGAGHYFYALNATTGAILWKTTLGTSNTNNDVIYSGSAVANGKVYVGISSLCDNPLTQGMLYALNITNGSIAAKAAIVPNGHLGGGIWSVPTIDVNTRTVIVTTGSIEKTNPIPMTASIVTLNWNTLAVKEYWQVPASERIADADWGCTPTLFPGPNGKTYVGCINKNSIYYVFDEANVSAGPIWQVKLGPGGNQGAITGSCGSASYVNGVLYIPTVLATVNGSSFAGSIGAFDALTGHQLWRFGTRGPVVGSVITANGLLYDAQGKTLEIRDTNTGKVLFSYTVGNIKGSITVSNGIVYIPSYDRHLYALA